MTEDERLKVFGALKVIALDEKISRYLAVEDPSALRMVHRALKVLEPSCNVELYRKPLRQHLRDLRKANAERGEILAMAETWLDRDI